ncbi:chitin deacetylase 7-like [Ischnura elegans]|uniref:chitin deacetylase 7-like n=1 Tax=Ischnura elegans TaxID=197161 RepID=UPI001ED89EF1|nr:chitin deacetylase 7-like [Ischnura elegans]
MCNMVLTCVLFGLLVVCASGAPRSECNDSNCKLPDCHCFGTAVPGGLEPKDIPQLVMLTFDDAIDATNYDDFYSKAFVNRRNPNGCNVSASFFTTHDYSDYMRTYELYRMGHEISLHSITHRTGTDYWATASVEQLEKEFIGQEVMLNKFGLIPKEAMKGIRAPYLQNAGDNTFEMLAKNNLKWDCSWPTGQNEINQIPWPYTLDFKSPQDCPIPPCPQKTHPGVWVVPMVDWMDDDGVHCSMVDACTYITDEDKLVEFMKANFHRHYDGNRAPFPFFLHAAWFLAMPMRFDAYNKFLDYLETLKDVYVVTVSQALEWIQNPTPTSQMGDFWKCWEVPEDTCKPIECHLTREDVGEERYMEICSPCPATYPWIDNPAGSK